MRKLKESLETTESEAAYPEIAPEEYGPEEVTPATLPPTEGSCATPIDEMLELVDDDKLDAIMQKIAARKHARAEQLRNLADETVRIAREALEEATARAAELEAKAETLDWIVTPRLTGIRRAVAALGSHRATEDPDALADELERIQVDESPNPKRVRKPKAEKPAKSAPKPKRGKRVMAPKTPKKTAKPVELDDHDKRILVFVRKGPAGVAEIADKCGLEQPYAARKCKKLVGIKLLVKLGDKRSTKYEAA
jgi:hypothetical protein